MEKLIKKTLSFPFKSFAKFFVSFGTLLVLAACGNKGSDNNTLGINGCVNCSGITSPVAISTFSSESLYITAWPVQMANVQLFVNGVNYQAGLSSPYNLYSGYVAVQGTLNVTGGVAIHDAVGACIVPPGVYTLQTVSMGTINMGADLIVPDLVAGPMRLKMSQGSIGGSMLYNESGAIRWAGRLDIVSVNGQPCSNFYSDMQ